MNDIVIVIAGRTMSDILGGFETTANPEKCHWGGRILVFLCHTICELCRRPGQWP